jgi:hypothetical protein
MVGGAREGAGRKPGSVTRKTREIAEQAAAEGVLPLEIMVRIMREQWERYTAGDKDPQAGMAALQAARDVAPYMHPRLSQTDAPIHLENFTGTPAERGQRVLDALADGELTPDQASTIMQAINAQMRIVEVDELERRIKALEERQHG